jgi:general secretion pathway protein C
MAVSLNPRAERLLARLPRVTVYSALELLLLLLIAVQCARLFWGLMTPIGPVGDFKALEQMRPVAVAAPSVGTFDPFFRQGPGATAAAQLNVVTSLNIRLYGISANSATGGGSAIIGAANGEQRVYMVGEEILPGVTLTGVGFDFVTISRGGQVEQLYLDQTPVGTPGSAPVAPPPPPPQMQPPPQPVQSITVPTAPPPAETPPTPRQTQ